MQKAKQKRAAALCTALALMLPVSAQGEASTPAGTEQSPPDVQQTQPASGGSGQTMDSEEVKKAAEEAIKASEAAAQAEEQEKKQALYEQIREQIKGQYTPEQAKQLMQTILEEATLQKDQDLIDYATYMLARYELEEQMAQLDSLLAAIKINAPALTGLDETVQNSLLADLTFEDVLSLLPADRAGFIRACKLEETPFFADLWTQITGLIATDTADFMPDPAQTGAQATAARLTQVKAGTRDFIAAVLLACIAENQIAQDRSEAAKQLETVCGDLSKQNGAYTAAEAKQLFEASQQFRDCGKYAAGVYPDHFIQIGGAGGRLSQPAIVYKDQLLISAEDAAVFLQAELEAMTHNDTVVLKSAQALIEFEKGSTQAYVNDAAYALPVPVLQFNGQVYIPAELYAHIAGAYYFSTADDHYFVMRV